MPASDQYVKLEEERKQRQRLQKDGRRRRRKDKRGPRRRGSLPTDSDEDVAPAQQVDIVTEEMPEVSPLAPRRAGVEGAPQARTPGRSVSLPLRTRSPVTRTTKTPTTLTGPWTSTSTGKCRAVQGRSVSRVPIACFL